MEELAPSGLRTENVRRRTIAPNPNGAENADGGNHATIDVDHLGSYIA
jgi:hypothetical protein